MQGVKHVVLVQVETTKLVAQVGGSSADKLQVCLSVCVHVHMCIVYYVQSCLADLSSSVSKLKQLRQVSL